MRLSLGRKMTTNSYQGDIQARYKPINYKSNSKPSPDTASLNPGFSVSVPTQLVVPT